MEKVKEKLEDLKIKTSKISNIKKKKCLTVEITDLSRIINNEDYLRIKGLRYVINKIEEIDMILKREG